MPPTHTFPCFLYGEIKIVIRLPAADKIVIETLQQTEK